MIFYFTGTGNSKWIAELLGKKLNERVVAINDLLRSDLINYDFEVMPDERIGLVFPVYSWGSPAPIGLFLDRLNLKNATNLFAVATCGGNAGFTNKILQKLLLKKGFTLTSCHTVEMPNCYILIPGFDVDSDEVANRKISLAPSRVDQIAEAVMENRQDDALYTTGIFPWIKSNFIYPSFVKNTKYTKFSV